MSIVFKSRINRRRFLEEILAVGGLTILNGMDCPIGKGDLEMLAH